MEISYFISLYFAEDNVEKNRELIIISKNRRYYIA